MLAPWLSRGMSRRGAGGGNFAPRGTIFFKGGSILTVHWGVTRPLRREPNARPARSASSRCSLFTGTLWVLVLGACSAAPETDETRFVDDPFDSPLSVLSSPGSEGNGESWDFRSADQLASFAIEGSEGARMEWREPGELVVRAEFSDQSSQLRLVHAVSEDGIGDWAGRVLRARVRRASGSGTVAVRFFIDAGSDSSRSLGTAIDVPVSEDLEDLEYRPGPAVDMLSIRTFGLEFHSQVAEPGYIVIDDVRVEIPND